MKKVLFVIRSYESNGATISLLNLLRSIDRNKYQVDVISFYKYGTLQNLFKKTANCSELFPSAFFKIPGLGVLFHKCMRSVSPSLLHIFFVRKKYDIEVAYVNDLVVRLTAGAGSNTLKCVWFHEGLNDCSVLYDVNAVIKQKEFRKIYSSFDRYICVSQNQATNLTELFKDTINLEQGQNLHVIKNVIDKKRVISMSKEVVGIEKTGFVFYACGRLQYEKGFDRLIDAARILKNKGYAFQIWILGEGTELSALQNRIIEYGLTEIVFLLGYKDNPYPYMRICDVVVCPSRRESYGLVIAEALILDKQIISTDCEGPAEQLRGTAGAHLVENSVDGICKGMESVLKFTS